MQGRERIVVIGGGTGSYTALRGLKNYDVDLTAVVSMMDSGGSSGRLRDEYGFLPPGDARRCLIALSPEGSKLRDLFEYRFESGSLEGHNFGNIFLTALRGISSSEEESLEQAAEILNIQGRVLPVTTKNCQLAAELENGQIVVGETNLDKARHNPNLKIERLMLVPEKVHAYRKSIDAILDADKVVIGPGDLYTSILPNMLVDGITDALAQTRAQKIYVCNIMTKHGETTGFKASDFVREIEKYLGTHVLNHVIVNNKRPDEHLLQKYAEENSEFVEPDIQETYFTLVKTDLLNGPELARHDPDKLAKAIMGINIFKAEYV